MMYISLSPLRRQPRNTAEQAGTGQMFGRPWFLGYVPVRNLGGII